MRAPSLALAVTCCAISLGCGRRSAERPSSSVTPAAAVPPATAKTEVPIKPPKKVAMSETPPGVVLDVTSVDSLDVNSINPVKMDTKAASGAGFNPFAK